MSDLNIDETHLQIASQDVMINQEAFEGVPVQAHLEDKQPVINLTKEASAQIKLMIANKSENFGKTLRVYVEGGGCSGMQYGMLFDDKRDGDIVAEFDGVSALVDVFSSTYLRGTVISYSDNLNSGGFKISNPNAQSSCGCGKSFEA